LIVNDEPAKQRILAVLSDEYSRRILAAIVDEPLSMLQLSKNYGIPFTTVYRRIQYLVDGGLIAAVKSRRTTDGKWYELYRSLLLRVDVTFDDGDVRVEAKLNDVSDRFTRIWTSVPTI